MALSVELKKARPVYPIREDLALVAEHRRTEVAEILRWGRPFSESGALDAPAKRWVCVPHNLLTLKRESEWGANTNGLVNESIVPLPDSHLHLTRCERFERASFERKSFERTIFSACHISDTTFERLSNTAIFNVSESRVSAKPISATTKWATVHLHPSETHILLYSIFGTKREAYKLPKSRIIGRWGTEQWNLHIA